jgi:hypothetical protein
VVDQTAEHRRLEFDAGFVVDHPEVLRYHFNIGERAGILTRGSLTQRCSSTNSRGRNIALFVGLLGLPHASSIIRVRQS